MRRVLGLGIAVLVGTALLGLSAGQALATTVHCGDVITQSATLDGDLLGCTRPALTLAGDGVTLDLNGHVVEGGVEAPRLDGPGFKGLLIENGTVRGGGIDVASYEDVTIEHLTVDGVVLGPDVDGALVEGNVIRDAPGGVEALRDSLGVTISDNLIERNDIGVAASHTGLVTLLKNTIRANSVGVAGGQGGDFTAVGNRIVGNGGDGIATNQGGMVLRHNLISENGGDGTHSEFGGIAEGTNNVISHNRGSGVYSTFGGVHLTNNTVSQNGVDGVHIGERDRGVLIGNRIDRNGDDGIDIDDPERLVENTLSGNHVWFNGDLGIEALPDTPGGGNWAKHNGNPAQCIPASLCSTKGKPKK